MPRATIVCSVTSRAPRSFDVIVIGAGPAGVIAALRAARLGARTALLSREEFGGMAANDGPVPVRTLAHAARLVREARQMPAYGIPAAEPAVRYPELLARVHEVTNEARRRSLLRDDLDEAGVTIEERFGPARFIDESTLEGQDGSRVRAQGHPLPWRRSTPAADSRHRADGDAQRRLGPDHGARVDRGARDRRDGRPGRLDLQCARRSRHARGGRPAHPRHRGSCRF
jgi:glycine/D-amino acid oxidase-like deaminating enzyme